MPPPYAPAHWNAFVGIPYVAAGPVGPAPALWVTTNGIGAGVPDAPTPLPVHPLTRTQVRAICLNPANPVMFGYVCAMAWGGQHRYVAAAFANAPTIIPKLNALRAGQLTRAQAYNLFLPADLGGGGNVHGLGPAFFTKLLYFFSPQPSFYIMDQWTAKSVNALTNRWAVRMAGDYVANNNGCGNYAAFCWEVDEMAALLGQLGHVTEERLFSKGARPPPIWPWRGYLKANWSAATAAFPPYNANAMHAVYGPLTALPLGAFL